jgi:6-phosphofructokinase 2
MLSVEGVPQQPVEIAGQNRESLAVTDRADGEQYRFLLPGPSLSEREWRACVDTALEQLDDEGWLVLSGSLPPGVPYDLFAQLTTQVKDRAHVLLDTSGPALEAALAAGTDVVNPNWREVDEIAAGEAEQDFAARLVDEGRANAVIVTLGARGARLTTADEQALLVPPAVEIVSPVGGGDCFAAALTLALSRGQSYLDATRLGVAAAAAAMSTPGTALFRRDDVERLLPDVCVQEPTARAV